MKILKNLALTFIISTSFSCGTSVISVTYTGDIDKSSINISNWEELPIKLNRAKNNVSCVLNENKLYIIGGDALSVWLSDVEEINLENNTSKLIEPLSFNRSGLGVEKIGDSIYSFGGYNGSNNTWSNSIEKLDLNTLKWSKEAPMNTSKSAFGIASIDNNIYIAGGNFENRGFINKFELYNPDNNLFSSKANLIENKAELSLIASEYGTRKEKRLYSIGGINENGFIDSIDEYNIKSDKWRTRAKMKIKRASISSVSLGSNIIIMGGYNKDLNLLDNIEVYNTNLNKVEKISNLPEPLSNFCSFTYNDELYIVGGRTNNGLSNLIRKAKIEKEN